MTEYSEQIKILCVDDERNVLRALERFFLDDNFEIVNASSAAEGLQALEESGPFQVVISDYRMPVMNGVEFLKAVYSRWPDTVRLVLSGYADVGAIVAAINEGHIYKFIPKPWNDEDLRVTIQNSLELYHLQKRNRELLKELAAANHTLEEKVRQRTKRLDLQILALEFSQNLPGSPATGVVAINAQGLIVYCNDKARKLLNNGYGDTIATDVSAECDASFISLLEQVRREKNISGKIARNGSQYQVLGHSKDFCGSEIVVLVFLEVAV